jgi:cytochrome c oxidase assembly protein subunit 15
MATVLVILGGSVVRATGSGAGCGDHWPRCQGQILPSSPSTETIIELTHRLMTGAAAVGVVVVLVLAYRLFPLRHRVRRAAAVSAALFVVEALIGAALVLYGWVDDDTSLGRLVVVPIHLMNTFLLLAALALTAWWGSGRPGPGPLRRSPLTRRIAVMAGLLLVIGAFGAWNALADTLHPAGSLAEGIEAELADSSSFLLRIRAFHPAVAVLAGTVVAFMALRMAEGAAPPTRGLGYAVFGIVLGQFAVGVVNLFLLTPVETQVLHLAVADVLWVTFVLFAASALSVVRARQEVAVT